MAHAALTDAGAGKFRYQKRYNRAGPGIAGASTAQSRVWNGNWSAEWRDGRQHLQAVANEFRFSLYAVSEKPPIVHGINGVSQKASGPGKASHYVSLTRLAVRGVVTVDGRTQDVTGMAWMDHEWFTHQLEVHQVGWDWFSVQLEDRTELMLFQLRQKDGGIDPHSAGTYVDVQGKARHLRREEFTLEPLAFWTSSRTKGQYPLKWRIRVPSLRLDVESVAVLRDQEIPGDGSAPAYWEGAVTYGGSHRGVGYLEMTGYDRPLVSFSLK
jgi:predicted secreted hydrolase